MDITSARCSPGQFFYPVMAERFNKILEYQKYASPKINSADNLADILLKIEEGYGTFVAAFYGILYAAGVRKFDVQEVKEILISFEDQVSAFKKRLPDGEKNSFGRVGELYVRFVRRAVIVADRDNHLLNTLRGYLRKESPELRGICRETAVMCLLFFLRLEIPIVLAYEPWAPGKEPHLFPVVQTAEGQLLALDGNESRVLAAETGQLQMLNHLGIIPMILREDGVRRMLELSDTEGALTACKLAKEIQPDSPMSDYKMAWILKQTGELAEAEAILLKIRSVGYVYVWDLLGQVYLDQERYYEAEKCFLRAIQIEAQPHLSDLLKIARGNLVK
ncbi:MAG: tetratricopeptide repeat protein [bacterium]